MHKTIAILAGDGIGPEVMQEAIGVLEAVAQRFDHRFTYQEALVGGAAYDEYQDALPQGTIDTCQTSDAILFGSVGGPKWESLPRNEQPERKALLGLRKQFGFFANLRPSIVYPEIAGKSVLKPEIVGKGFDLLIVRELTGGIYFSQPRGTEDLPDGTKRAFDTMAYTTEEIVRIGRVAFEAAQKRNKKLTSVDKANVLDCSVLWREVITKLAQEYPDVQLNHLYVDNACMQVVINPKQFDVIVTSNMFGDILSDLSSVLPGSLGMLASASFGSSSFGMYEPSGGSAPDIAGKGIANPIAQILSAAMMLKFSFGMQAEALAIEGAVQEVLRQGYRTGDIMSEGMELVNTVQMGQAIATNVLQR